MVELHSKSNPVKLPPIKATLRYLPQALRGVFMAFMREVPGTYASISAFQLCTHTHTHTRVAIPSCE